MKGQLVTNGIVLARTNFQEADRIVTVLTPDHGKLRVIAKGSRRPKSKLAGGIELFSESELTVLSGRGQVQTLVSARMGTHYGNIAKDIRRTMLGYELLKRLNRVTEDEPGDEYYHLLKGVLKGLDDLTLAPELTEFWFWVRLLDVSGHAPNFLTDSLGNNLKETEKYLFDYELMCFVQHKNGSYDANYIRLWRLARSLHVPNQLGKVTGAIDYMDEALKMLQTMIRASLR